MAEFKGTTLDNAQELVYLVGNIGDGQEECSGCSQYRGYRKELLKEKLSLLEESFMTCGRCTGVLRQGCTIKEGLAQVCRDCVESDEVFQPIGAIRPAVLKIACVCPLSDRGCEWNGVLGTVLNHLEECDQFVVTCPFVKYGCKKELKRQGLEEHRTEAKEYHTEVVSVFMAEKVEKLEDEKKQQAGLIMEQNKKIEKLEKQIQQLISFKNFTKFEGVNWVIQDRHIVVNKYNEKQNKPQDAKAENAVEDGVKYGGDLNNSVSTDANYTGPRFVIGTYYYLSPKIIYTSKDEVTIQICSNNPGLYDEKINWPLEGKCIVKLVNQINDQDCIFENDKFQLNKDSSFNVTNIPFETLLDEKYKKGNSIMMDILFQLHP